jgi:hypothetical protein
MGQNKVELWSVDCVLARKFKLNPFFSIGFGFEIILPSFGAKSFGAKNFGAKIFGAHLRLCSRNLPLTDPHSCRIIFVHFSNKFDLFMKTTRFIYRVIYFSYFIQINIFSQDPLKSRKREFTTSKLSGLHNKTFLFLIKNVM